MKRGVFFLVLFFAAGCPMFAQAKVLVSYDEKIKPEEIKPKETAVEVKTMEAEDADTANAEIASSVEPIVTKE